MTGTVVSIHIARTGEAAMESVHEVRAVVGQGLEGDRYFRKAGTYSNPPGPDREATLLEAEAIEVLARDYGIDIAAGDARRNVVTRGVTLNHFVGCDFRVGEVVLHGIRLCEPSAHLSRLVGANVVPGLPHRGGLRAAIRSTGAIRVGDDIRKASPDELDAAGLSDVVADASDRTGH